MLLVLKGRKDCCDSVNFLNFTWKFIQLRNLPSFYDLCLFKSVWVSAVHEINCGKNNKLSSKTVTLLLKF